MMPKYSRRLTLNSPDTGQVGKILRPGPWLRGKGFSWFTREVKGRIMQNY